VALAAFELLLAPTGRAKVAQRNALGLPNRVETGALKGRPNLSRYSRLLARKMVDIRRRQRAKSGRPDGAFFYAMRVTQRFALGLT
jgi:hypothetical protein